MPKKIAEIFKPSPTSVMSSATPSTLEFNFTSHARTTAAHTSDSGWTSATAPAPPSAPAQLIGGTARRSLTLSAPTDGVALLVGDSVTMTTANSKVLFPGDVFIMTGPIGPVWTQAVGPAATFFYRTT